MVQRLTKLAAPGKLWFGRKFDQHLPQHHLSQKFHSVFMVLNLSKAPFDTGELKFSRSFLMWHFWSIWSRLIQQWKMVKFLLQYCGFEQRIPLNNVPFKWYTHKVWTTNGAASWYIINYSTRCPTFFVSNARPFWGDAIIARSAKTASGASLQRGEATFILAGTYGRHTANPQGIMRSVFTIPLSFSYRHRVEQLREPLYETGDSVSFQTTEHFVRDFRNPLIVT